MDCGKRSDSALLFRETTCLLKEFFNVRDGFACSEFVTVIDMDKAIKFTA